MSTRIPGPFGTATTTTLFPNQTSKAITNPARLLENNEFGISEERRRSWRRYCPEPVARLMPPHWHPDIDLQRQMAYTRSTIRQLFSDLPANINLPRVESFMNQYGLSAQVPFVSIPLGESAEFYAILKELQFHLLSETPEQLGGFFQPDIDLAVAFWDEDQLPVWNEAILIHEMAHANRTVDKLPWNQFLEEAYADLIASQYTSIIARQSPEEFVSQDGLDTYVKDPIQIGFGTEETEDYEITFQIPGRFAKLMPDGGYEISAPAFAATALIQIMARSPQLFKLLIEGRKRRDGNYEAIKDALDQVHPALYRKLFIDDVPYSSEDFANHALEIFDILANASK